MQQKIAITISGSVIVGGLFAQQQENSNPKKPNIVIFIADDAGMDLGCYGNKVIQTPNIDALAANGLRFSEAYVTSPQSSPSRTSMLTGSFAHTIGTEDLHAPLNDTTKIITSYLQNAGYYTGLMLKSHIGNNGMKQINWFDNGFESWQKGEWHDKCIGNLNTFLDKKEKNPFFLWVAFVDPHRPYVEDKIAANRAPEIHNPAKITIPPYLANTKNTKIDIAHYYDEIARMDKYIGLMMAELKRRGELENTIIIFMSDNGMPFPRCKGTLYDKGIQTPFIVSWPGVIKAGTNYNNQFSTVDLAPTLLDVAGVKKPVQMYGQSVSKIFSNQSIDGRKYIFAERNWHNTDEHIRCVRTDKYKLIVNSYIELPHGSPADVASSLSWYDLCKIKNKKVTAAQLRLFECPRPVIELYDHEKDPYELVNLADNPDYINIGKQLAAELSKWMKETNDFSPHKRRLDDNIDRVTGFPYNGLINKEYWED
jgi:arylsulfatase A-like enzyme